MIKDEDYDAKKKQFDKAANEYHSDLKNSKLEVFSLKDSKLQKMKLDILTHNLERYTKVDLNQEVLKIINKQVNVEYDLESLLPVLFLSLKVNEYKEGLSSYDYSNNYSQSMDLLYFFSLYNESPDFLRNDDIDFEIDRFKNYREELVKYSDINSFQDIYEKDNFFTFIKHKDSLKTVILLAELFTENSKLYSEVNS
jgi:hypothetical protein